MFSGFCIISVVAEGTEDHCVPEQDSYHEGFLLVGSVKVLGFYRICFSPAI